MAVEPKLTAATLIHGVVSDLLHQRSFSYAHFPEVVDLAVICTGLGTVQSGFSFVKQVGSFWDSTYWDAHPRPFLDTQSLAYANAVAAWIRNDQDPGWVKELPSDIKRPMKKSLKYLFKTNDSFFHPSTARQSLLKQAQDDWLRLAGQSSMSTQVVAIRHLEPSEQLSDQRESLLLDKLQSPSRAIVLHSISAVESLKITNEHVVNELKSLIENRDDEIRAKAIIALTKIAQLDEMATGVAAKMVDSGVRYVVFAGMFALCSLESVSDQVLRVAERGFSRALQTCDYDFIGLFAAGFNRWLEDPQYHFEQLFQDNEPEYLEIAIEALQNIREQSIALS